MPNILIIDDDEHISEMLREALTAEGFGVSAAYSGTEALMLLSKEKPELILLDEPTAGMDPVFKKDFYMILKKYLDRGGCSVIMSSNLNEDIENHFDYTGYFENGVFTRFTENTPV